MNKWQVTLWIWSRKTENIYILLLLDLFTYKYELHVRPYYLKLSCNFYLILFVCFSIYACIYSFNFDS